MSPSFLQQLLGRLRQEPGVRAVYIDRRATAPGSGEVEEVALHLAVEGPFAQAVRTWAASLPDLAYRGAEPHGLTLITADGVEWRLVVHGARAALDGGCLQPVFDRRAQPAGGDEGESGAGAGERSSGVERPVSDAGQAQPDLAVMAGAFWRDLYRAGRAIRAERPLTAHHWLFACGGHLIDLYRLALDPGCEGRGWVDADEVPGLLRALEPVRESLAAPVECRAQRRAAHRLAEAFEGLVLPLCRRIGVEYPMALRTLAFLSLDAERGGPGPEAAQPPGGPGSGSGSGSARGGGSGRGTKV